MNIRKEIEEKIVDVQEKYWDAESELRGLYQQLADLVSPFTVGDVIHGNRYKDGKPKDCAVLKVWYTWPTGTTELVVADVKKDGELAAKPYRLYSVDLTDDKFKKTGRRDVTGVSTECLGVGAE